MGDRTGIGVLEQCVGELKRYLTLYEVRS